MKYLAALFVLGLSPTVFADSLGNPLEDRFRLTAGLFSANTTTEARIDSDANLAGTLFSAEDDFGLRARSEMADVEVELRPRKRHKLRFNYFQLERSSDIQLQRNIRFGNDLYLVTNRVSTRFDVSDFTATYSYLFLRRERFEIGASLGLHLFQFDTEAEVPARNLKERESHTGPVPAVGLEATVRFSQRWHAEARAEYLSVSVDDAEASMQNIRAAVFYRFNDNIAVGAGYVTLSEEVTVADPGDSGHLSFENSGGELLLRIAF